MRNIVLCAAVVLATGARLAADDLPKADTILDKYIEATGGKAAYEKNHTEVSTGSMATGASFSDAAENTGLVLPCGGAGGKLSPWVLLWAAALRPIPATIAATIQARIPFSALIPYRPNSNLRAELS